MVQTAITTESRIELMCRLTSAGDAADALGVAGETLRLDQDAEVTCSDGMVSWTAKRAAPERPRR